MNDVVILGGGLTGLTAAYVLQKHGAPVRVTEAAPLLGGASRTVVWNDFRFDLGGHRFYTRDERVLGLVNELIGDEMLRVQRISRIYLHGHFVDYPLSFFNALRALGPVTSCAVTASYLKEKACNLVRRPPDVTFEDWVVSRFGRRLYEIYFKTYSEKVWGVPCEKMEADFAAQRIKGLSFREAVKSMFARKATKAASLVDEFLYPRLGFGRIPETMVAPLPPDRVHAASPVVRVRHDGRRVNAVTIRHNGAEQTLDVGQAIVTFAISDFVQMLDPAPPQEVLDAAATLKYRDILIIFATFNRPQVSPDHWIYFPDPDLFFGRFHEPKNWSAAMAPADKTGLVIEVFCYEHEPVWSRPDAALMRDAATELERLGLLRANELAGGTVIRFRKAYPLYEAGYRQAMDTIMAYLGSLGNLHCAGRNALFRYTSGDRYIEMGIKTAENILGIARHNVAAIATEQEYAEQ